MSPCPGPPDSALFGPMVIAMSRPREGGATDVVGMASGISAAAAVAAGEGVGVRMDGS